MNQTGSAIISGKSTDELVSSSTKGFRISSGGGTQAGGVATDAATLEPKTSMTPETNRADGWCGCDSGAERHLPGVWGCKIDPWAPLVVKALPEPLRFGEGEPDRRTHEFKPAPSCCNFHATGGHHSDRHGFSNATAVYGPKPWAHEQPGFDNGLRSHEVPREYGVGRQDDGTPVMRFGRPGTGEGPPGTVRLVLDVPAELLPVIDAMRKGESREQAILAALDPETGAYAKGKSAGAAEEREACAKVADDEGSGLKYPSVKAGICSWIAARIRRRGAKRARATSSMSAGLLARRRGRRARRGR